MIKFCHSSKHSINSPALLHSVQFNPSEACSQYRLAHQDRSAIQSQGEQHTFNMLPDFMKFFSRMLSRQGSNSSPTSSISIGRPSERLSSRNCLKYLFVSVVTVNCLSASLFLIHALPWPWGSISKGYRVALVTMMPFWVDSSSLGKPCRAHSETYVQDIMEQHILVPQIVHMHMHI